MRWRNRESPCSYLHRILYSRPSNQKRSFHFHYRSDTSVLEAASNGAFTATNLILGIVANLIAFVSFIAFANGITHWLGYLIGYDYLSFELFFAKLFIPLSYIIGIPWEDCEKIGQVIAMKTIVNEFVAYERLGELKRSGEVSVIDCIALLQWLTVNRYDKQNIHSVHNFFSSCGVQQSQRMQYVALPTQDL